MSDDTTPVAVDQDPEPEKFEPSEEQKQYFGSWMGRMVKKHIEEGVSPQIDEIKQLLAQKNEPSGDELTEKILNGSAKEVIEKVLEEREQKKQILKTAQEKDLQKAMVGYKDDPLYKDVYADAEKLARDAMSKGYPAGPAAEIGYAKASKNHLLNRDPEYKLQMSGSGKPQKRTKKAELPAALKTAAKRDIADGIFKDEAEYIENLTPEQRTRYGI